MLHFVQGQEGRCKQAGNLLQDGRLPGRQAGSGNRSNQESEQQLGLKTTHKCERQSGTEQWQDGEYGPCQ